MNTGFEKAIESLKKRMVDGGLPFQEMVEILELHEIYFVEEIGEHIEHTQIGESFLTPGCYRDEVTFMLEFKVERFVEDVPYLDLKQIIVNEDDFNELIREFREEAIRRLYLLNTPLQIIKNLEKNEVMKSRNGILRKLDESDRELLKRFNERTGHYPFHIIEDDSYINVLFVSKYEDDWNAETMLIDNNQVYAYVIDKERDYTEIGIINVVAIKNTLMRVN